MRLHSDYIQSLGAVFMIITFTTTATNDGFSITNLCTTLITSTLSLSCENNRKSSYAFRNLLSLTITQHREKGESGLLS